MPRRPKACDLDRDKFKQIVVDFDLQRSAACSLYRLLARARKRYEIKQLVQDSSSATAARSKLIDIEHSVRMIVSFSKELDDAPLVAFEQMVESGGEFANTLKEQAATLGGRGKVQIRQFGRDFDARTFVFNWFRDALPILEILQRAKRALKSKTNLNAWLNELPPKAWLYGEELPRIYELICNAEFGISKDADGEIREVGGVAFVIRAASVLGLKPIKPITLRTHHRRVQKNLTNTPG